MRVPNFQLLNSELLHQYFCLQLKLRHFSAELFSQTEINLQKVMFRKKENLPCTSGKRTTAQNPRVSRRYFIFSKTKTLYQDLTTEKTGKKVISLCLSSPFFSQVRQIEKNLVHIKYNPTYLCIYIPIYNIYRYIIHARVAAKSRAKLAHLQVLFF